MESATSPGTTLFPLGAIGRLEPPAQGMQRVAIELDRRALTRLDASEAPDPETIHALRVTCKRLRALWQLQRPTVNREAAKRANARLRDAARTMAAQRARHVLLELLEDMGAHVVPDMRVQFDRAAQHLTENLAAGAVPGGEQLGLRVALEADNQAWLDLIPIGDVELFEAGFGRTISRATDLGRAALASRHPEELHRWRRWVKYLRYQIEPLAEPWRLATTVFYRDLKQLGRLLGHRNDLQDLNDQLVTADVPAVEAALTLMIDTADSSLPDFEDTLFQTPREELVALLRRDCGV